MRERGIVTSREAWIALAVLLGLVLVSSAPGGAQPAAEREQQARALFDQERYAGAAAMLQSVLAEDPSNRVASILLPFALARQGNVTAAIPQARRALGLFPNHTGLQLLLAGLLSQLEAGREEALQRFQAVIDRDPNNLLAQLGLAETLRALGRSWEAVRHFTLLADRVPTDPRYADRLGQLYGALGDLDRAQTHFERAYRLDPKDLDAVRSLALLADVGDRPQDAVRYYRELLDLYPADVSAQMAVRESEDRLAEPGFPMPIAQMQRIPLDTYLKAAADSSKTLQYRRDQLEATRARSVARFLPSFFFSPSVGTVHRQPKPNSTDETSTWSFSFGWNLSDLVADPYRINITGMQADIEAVRLTIVSDVSATYYQRLQNIVQYRQFQRQLALEPLNGQIRQNKQTVKYTILTLTERLKALTGIP